jgi:hypothetical protein
MLDVTPDEVRAIVVGVDHYDYGDSWKLTGPAADALRTVDWLLENGVLSKHIALFLSPASWSEPHVTSWMERTGWKQVRDAKYTDIAYFINMELRPSAGKALLVHWGGHGSVDRKKPLNYLFSSDAVGGTPNCLCVQELLIALADSLFEHLMQQVLIFDVCAAPFTLANDHTNPNPARLIKSETRNVGVQQCPMYAASPGKLATNVSKRGAGLFSELLFAELKAYKQPALEQFVQAFNDIKKEEDHNGLRAQQPCMDFPFLGSYSIRSKYLRPGSLPSVMLDLINSRGISAGLVRWAYLQSIPDITRMRENLPPMALLLDLKDAMPRAPGYPEPLIEFAERLGRETKDPSLSTWARTNSGTASYNDLTRKLDDEKTAHKSIATLFIQIESANATQFQWWIDAPNPEHRTGKKTVPLGKDVLKKEFEKWIPAILLDAKAMTFNHYLMRIGLIVPAELFSSELDLVTVRCEGDDDFILNDEHAVVFHWYDRTVRKRQMAIEKYEQVLKTLAPRIEQAACAKVLWLDVAESKTDAQRYVRASDELSTGATQAICLGIDLPFNAQWESNLTTILECLKQGVPCLFWSQRPKTAKKAQEARDRISRTFGLYRPDTAPIDVWRHRKTSPQKEQIATIRVVWDTPGFRPYSQARKSLLEDHQ